MICPDKPQPIGRRRRTSSGTQHHEYNIKVRRKKNTHCIDTSYKKRDFDKCLSIHEKGWTKPSVYKVEAKRGDKKDVFKNRVEGRLFEVVETLRVSKAACNDALQGGITLLRLCYNPKQLRCSKDANKVGNFVKKVRLEVGKQTLDSSEDADGEDAGGEEDGGEEDGSEE